MTLTSYCVICDALPNECDHNTHRYLDDIVYEPGPHKGWIVPDHERERWDQAPLRPTPPKPASTTKDLDELADLIRNAFWLEPSLEEDLENAYDRNPTQTTLATVYCLSAINTGRINNPGGFLRTKLRAIR